MMKFLIVFTIFPTIIFCQELTVDDLNIFINNFENITEDIYNIENISVANYRNSIDNVIDNYEQYLDETFSLGYVFEKYLDFLNIDVPKDIEIVFKKYGWKDDGHKKFWTLFNIARYSVIFFYLRLDDVQCKVEDIRSIINENDNEETKRIIEILKKFHINDLELVYPKVLKFGENQYSFLWYFMLG